MARRKQKNKKNFGLRFLLLIIVVFTVFMISASISYVITSYSIHYTKLYEVLRIGLLMETLSNRVSMTNMTLNAVLEIKMGRAYW